MKKAQYFARPRRIGACLLLALMAALTASCGKRAEREPVFPVTGKLVDGGKPAEKAMLVLYPVNSSASHGLRPVGKVAADGSFRLSTYKANDGVPAGQYAVTVVWPTVPKNAPPDLDEGPDRLEGHCNNPKTSPWHVHVEGQAIDMGTLDLQSWPQASSPERKAPAHQRLPTSLPE